LDPGEKILCLTTLTEDSLGLALGTARGIVKRVNPEVLGKDSWDVIRLDAGDRVVGAVELTTAQTELVFITNDAQLLHFPASAVRPQGRSGGGMAGIKLGIGASVIYFGAVSAADAVVVTVSGSSRALPGTDAGSVKVTGFEHHPAKGPGNRRDTLPPVPQRRGFAAARLGGAGTCRRRCG
jgi:DNA gyrase subunit A